MTHPLTWTHAHEVPVPQPVVLDQMITVPLEEIFARRYLALPAVREVRDQDGEWGSVGQTRTVVLSDGGTMVETLTSVDRPDAFGYRLGPVTGPMGRLTDGIEGEWRFEPAGHGTRVSWTWTVRPAGAVAGLVLGPVGAMWRGYAERALTRLGHYLR